MSPRALVVAVAGSTAVLGLAWTVDQAQTAMQTAPIPVPPPVGAPPGTTDGMRPAVSVSTVRGRRPRSVERRYTGMTVHTRFGPMRVRIAMRAGRLVRVWTVRLTDRYGRSVRASTAAAPVLERRSIAAGSAKIVGVTEATYTSDGYKLSLQSALDQAAGR
jgi:uncharacterized protein with FMN-binding domain